MIKKTSEGYQVVSHSGKPLSDNDLSYMQAKDRLKEVDFFKRVKTAQDEGKKSKSKKPKAMSNPSSNTGGKSMEELMEMKKQQDERKANPHGKPDKSYIEKYKNKTNLNEPNPTAKDNTAPVAKDKTVPVNEKPMEHFERIKKGFDKKYQQSIDKVFYGK